MAAARIPGTHKHHTQDKGTTARHRAPRPGTTGAAGRHPHAPVLIPNKKIHVIIMMVEDFQQTLIDSDLHDKDIVEKIRNVKEIENNIIPVLRKIGFTGKVRIATNATGKAYMILTEVSRNPKVGNLLRGTRYVAENAQVAKLLIATPAKLAEEFIRGTEISILIVGGMDVVEYYLSDPRNRGDLSQHIVADEMEAIICALAGGIATATAIAFSAPAIVIVASGLAVSYAISLMLDRDKDSKAFLDATARALVSLTRKKLAAASAWEQDTEDSLSDWVAYHFIE